MSVGIRVPACGPLGEIARFARRAEEAGVQTLWFPDSQLLWRDVFMAMALAAEHTESIELATGVTNLKTRHPSVIASSVRSLQELAPGRVLLGLGAGNSSVRPVGMSLATTSEIELGIGAIRSLLSGEVTLFGDRKVRLRDARESCSIYLATTGPRRLELAGRIADGVILHRGSVPGQIEPALELIAEGAMSAGRDMSSIDIVVSAVTIVTGDPKAAARQLKPICLTMWQDGGADALEAAGIHIDPAKVPSDGAPTDAVYPDFKHAEDWERAIESADSAVSDDDAMAFGDQFCFVGKPDDLAVRFNALSAIGVKRVFLQGISSYELPEAFLDVKWEAIAS